MNRRRFLGAAGAAAAMFPVLRVQNRALAGPDDGGPRRVIMIGYEGGTAGPMWEPDREGASFTLPFITAPLAERGYADRCLFISNIDHTLVNDAEFVSGHAGRREAVFTNTLTTDFFGPGGANTVSNLRPGHAGEHHFAANGPSVCHALGEQLRTSRHTRTAITLGVTGNTRNPARNDPSAFFFDRAGSPVETINNPAQAFTDLFSALQAPETPDPAIERRRRRNASVLDAVRDSFRDARQGLSVADRRTLDFHADYIRQIELDLGSRLSCSVPGGIPTGEPNIFDGTSMMERADYQIRMLAHAMACDMAPVGRLEFAHQDSANFGIASIADMYTQYQADGSGSGFHAIIHGDGPYETTTRPDRWDMTTDHMDERSYHPSLLEGYRFYVQCLADLLYHLDQFEEGPDGRTVLDNSLVVWASDLSGQQNHYNQRHCVILAGNLNGARTGFHFNAAPGGSSGRPGQDWFRVSDYNHNHFINTVARIGCLRDAGGELVDEFGIQGFASGTLPVF